MAPEIDTKIPASEEDNDSFEADVSYAILYLLMLARRIHFGTKRKVTEKDTYTVRNRAFFRKRERELLKRVIALTRQEEAAQDDLRRSWATGVMQEHFERSIKQACKMARDDGNWARAHDQLVWAIQDTFAYLLLDVPEDDIRKAVAELTFEEIKKRHGVSLMCRRLLAKATNRDAWRTTLYREADCRVGKDPNPAADGTNDPDPDFTDVGGKAVRHLLDGLDLAKDRDGGDPELELISALESAAKAVRLRREKREAAHAKMIAGFEKAARGLPTRPRAKQDGPITYPLTAGAPEKPSTPKRRARPKKPRRPTRR